jgi:hypothetical protein
MSNIVGVGGSVGARWSRDGSHVGEGGGRRWRKLRRVKGRRGRKGRVRVFEQEPRDRFEPSDQSQASLG